MKFSKEQLEVLRRRFRLSPRETEIIDLLFQGVSANRALAESLGITVGTAKGMLTRIFLKTGTTDKPTLLVRCLAVLLPCLEAEVLRRLRREGPDEAGPPAK